MSSGSTSHGLRFTCWHRSRRSQIPGFWPRISIKESSLTSPLFNRNRRYHSTVAAQVPDNGPNEPTRDQGAKVKSAWSPVPYRRKPNTKNIVVGDLTATLKAHREVNKDRIVRRIRSDRGGFDTRRLVLQTTGTRGAEPKLSENVEESAKYADAPSLPPRQNSGTVDPSSLVPSEGFSSTSESTPSSVSLDISKDRKLSIKTKDKALYRGAQGVWASWGMKESETIPRPWINHVRVEEIDPLLR